MKLIEYVRKHCRGPGFKSGSVGSGKLGDIYGQEFFDAWDQAFGIRTLPEPPGRYANEE